MSTTIVSVLALLLSQVLPAIGVDFGPEEIERGVQFVVTLVVGIYLYFHRVSKGDVNPLGFRK